MDKRQFCRIPDTSMSADTTYHRLDYHQERKEYLESMIFLIGG